MKSSYMVSCAAAAILCATAGAAAAQETLAANTAAASGAGQSSAVEDIVVTAQRRNESVQKVPMTVQALTGQTLSQLNIQTFDDLIKFTPNVSYASNGPGQGNIFMRGLSTGFVGNQSSATVASFPNVAVYLDDQSMSFPSRNADIYMVDMQRVEVLEGPQGTLFGGGAEAGAVRYITNKPKMNVFEGNAEASYGFTAGGGDNASANFTINLPIVEDKLAARVVVYDEHQGGYINNVRSTFTRSNLDTGNYYLGIAPKGGKCPNGLPPGSAGCTINNGVQYNNDSIAGSNSNPVDYQGARLSVLWDINPDWNVLITESLQNMDAEGLSAEYPVGSDFQTLKPLQITAFTPSWDKDRLENTAWTINGKVNALRLIYTGGYSERNISQQADYTNYSRSGGGMAYQCTGPSSYWANPGPTTCYSPYAYWNDKVRSTHLSNELRVSSPDDWRLRFIVGGYQEQFRIYDVMNFSYKTIPACTANYLASVNTSQYPCVGNLVPAAGTTINDPSVRGDNVGFGEDTQRGYDQYAVFGSVDYDLIPNVLTITGGTRWYQYNEFEVGSQYSAASPECANVPICTAGLTNINAENYKSTYSGFRSRANITWHIDPSTMAYFTFSQGFRPGGFNRSNHKEVIPDPNNKSAEQFLEPGSYAPDSLTNYEIGVKTALFDHRLLLNVSAYYMNWDNVQFFLFDPPAKINTTFGINGPSYDVKGVEFQATGRATEHLTLFASGSYNDDTESKAPCLIGNVPNTTYYGKCIQGYYPSGASGPESYPSPFGTVGSVPAFSPNFQGNIRARYDWEIREYKAFAQVGGNYVGSMWNQPASYVSGNGVVIPTTVNLRYEQPAYETLDASIGISKDKWRVELYGSNLTNSHASTFTSSAQFIKSEVPLRPLVIGLKVGASF